MMLACFFIINREQLTIKYNYIIKKKIIIKQFKCECKTVKFIIIFKTVIDTITIYFFNIFKCSEALAIDRNVRYSRQTQNIQILNNVHMN